MICSGGLQPTNIPFHASQHPTCVQFSSVAQSCPTLCDPMNRSTPGLPVHHHLLESTQTHVHRVHDAIQPSHPRSSASPPAPNPSQHLSLFQSLCKFLYPGNSPVFGMVHSIHSVQFSRSVLSNSLRPHELQHARPPCPWKKRCDQPR